jgi:hypothetical protein
MAEENADSVPLGSVEVAEDSGGIDYSGWKSSKGVVPEQLEYFQTDL